LHVPELFFAEFGNIAWKQSRPLKCVHLALSREPARAVIRPCDATSSRRGARIGSDPRRPGPGRGGAEGKGQRAVRASSASACSG
jgi:hypothetical protein